MDRQTAYIKPHFGDKNLPDEKRVGRTRGGGFTSRGRPNLHRRPVKMCLGEKKNIGAFLDGDDIGEDQRGKGSGHPGRSF